MTAQATLSEAQLRFLAETRSSASWPRPS